MKKQKELSNFKILSLIIIALSLIVRLLWMKDHTALVQEAYYWNYAQHLDFSYYDHPPMVAYFIKLAIILFGTSAFVLHSVSLFCWLISALILFYWVNKIQPGYAVFAVLIFSILPYFFVQSMVITPDMPVTIFWALTLFALYEVFILDKAYAWYKVGLFLGLGLLSKYTIALLGFTTIIYCIFIRSARKWWLYKEPYIAALIAILLFSPVIYWNYTHEWVSFWFQSIRRFNTTVHFGLIKFIGLSILFITPVGISSLYNLYFIKNIDVEHKRFFQLFIFLPWSVFCWASLSHGVKFDWIGPGLVAIIPWCVYLLAIDKKFLYSWIITAIILVISYEGLLLLVTYNGLAQVHETILKRDPSWKQFNKDLCIIAQDFSKKTNTKVLVVTMDAYHLASQINLYQKNNKCFDLLGSHIFARDSLMYNYWDDKKNLSGKFLVVIADNSIDFKDERYTSKINVISQGKELPLYSVHGNFKIAPLYYQYVQYR